MVPENSAVLLKLIEQYGEARERAAAALHVDHSKLLWSLSFKEAEKILNSIKEILGPSLADMMQRYAAGETLDSIAKSSGLSYWTVRTSLLRAGVMLRPAGPRRKAVKK